MLGEDGLAWLAEGRVGAVRGSQGQVTRITGDD